MEMELMFPLYSGIDNPLLIEREKHVGRPPVLFELRM